jgi:hypothetical protein
MSCSNNQQQLVLALHNYHDSYQTLPWGEKGSSYGTWAMLTLPFIEKEQIYANYDWTPSRRYMDVPNRNLLHDVMVSTYSCPSDSNRNKGSYTETGCNFKHHNHVVCMGRESVWSFGDRRNLSAGYNPSICLIDGVVFARESRYRAMFIGSCLPSTGSVPADPLTISFNDVTDGLSNTLALSETVQGISPDNAANDLRGMVWWGDTCYFTTNQSPNTMTHDLCKILYLTAHTKHPLSPMLSTGGYSPNLNLIRMSARSWHVGGVNSGLGDGSIRFVPNQIDLEIWRGAGSTNGDEVTSLP